MNWCRIIESPEGQYLLTAIEGPEGWGMSASWMAPNGVCLAVLPGNEFKGREDCLEFLQAVGLDAVRRMRRNYESAIAHSVAEEAIEKAMRGPVH